MAALLWELNRQPKGPVFPSIRSGPLSRDAIERLVARHCKTAQSNCPSLRHKKVTLHVLRHTAAMELLHHGVDRSVIALWLGHESVETTQMYLHADMRLKRKALSRITPLGVKPSLFKPDDVLLPFLEDLLLCRLKLQRSQQGSALNPISRHNPAVGMMAQVVTAGFQTGFQIIITID